MPETNATIVEETQSAVRGTIALLMGDRGAPRYFSFTQAGLVTSFIALLVALAAELVVSMAFGTGRLFAGVVQNVVAYGAFFVTSAIYLRQIGRSDGFVPFIVTVNWANALLSLVLLVATVMGLTFVSILFLVASLVLLINVGRLVMTLKPMQIALLILVQFVGLVAAVLVVMMIYPPTPEQLAAIAAATSR